MQQEFWATLSKAVAVASEAESKPSTSTSTEPSGSSPPRVLWTYQQHAADYIRLIMEDSGDLTMGEDRAATLIKEVFSSMLLSYTNL